MRYQKIRGDYLFNGEKLLDRQNILITDPEGTILEIVDEREAGEDIRTYRGLIAPGLVNAHCHLELSHLKGKIPERTGLAGFIHQVVSLRQAGVEEIGMAIEKAESEMVQNGIVAVGDISNHSITTAIKEQFHLKYCNFIEILGWQPEKATGIFERTKAVYDEFVRCDLKASVVPHAPYSVSEDLWSKIIPLFRGKVISIHNQETAAEDLFFREGKGSLAELYQKMGIGTSSYKPPKTGSVEHYFRKLASAASVLLVHNTFTGQEDIDFIRDHQGENQLVSYCLCPNANLYIENTMPPVELLVRNGCPIVLGTDSLASNHQLDLLEEIKTISSRFPDIPTQSILQWATINGARALQMENEVGSFRKGSRPGIILIDHLDKDTITPHSTVTNLVQEGKAE